MKYLQIKLFFALLIIPLIIIVVVAWFLPHFPPPYILTTAKTDNYYHKKFSVRQPNGQYTHMLDVYWLQDKLLSTEDLIKILEATQENFHWKNTFDDSNYSRWRRSDDRIEATHRKKDGKLIIYRKEFADWQNKHEIRNKKLILKILN